jgi:hypothetical protein
MADRGSSGNRAAIRPTRVRYIKLGEGGSWEKECLDKGIIRYGFGSAKGERFPYVFRGNGTI